MKAIHIIIGSALITAAALKAAPALAEAPVGANNLNVTIVRTADLDLNSKFGIRQLDHRLSAAAREVCGTASDFDLAGKNQVRACREEVLARARVQRDTVVAQGATGSTIAVTASR